MHRPALFEAYLPFLRQVAGPGDLDPKLKDLSAVLVGWLNGCRYTVNHRCTSAMRNGATEAELMAIAAGDWSAFDSKARLALDLTKQMTCRIPDQSGWRGRRVAHADLGPVPKRPRSSN
jgi:AhpD family alkylhydroperoxidase